MKKPAKNAKRLFPFALAGALMLMGMGCGEDDALQAPVAIHFDLLNEAGEKTTTFKAGEDIIFDYRMQNLSDEDITWY
ncbi:MAG: hypothetical protein JJU28_04875 [Cyclobacteriaceae bacterium]|nr:hypothetical protein [Cyclobacteriaceae bacterium]